MSKAAMGAKVKYCGHAGWFLADIFHFNGVNAVKANKEDCPITPNNIIRGRDREMTHALSDWPKAGFWCPERGIFVVPDDQVFEITNAPKLRLLPKEGSHE